MPRLAPAQLPAAVQIRGFSHCWPDNRLNNSGGAFSMPQARKRLVVVLSRGLVAGEGLAQEGRHHARHIIAGGSKI